MKKINMFNIKPLFSRNTMRKIVFSLIPITALGFTIYFFIENGALKNRYIEVIFAEGTNIIPDKTKVLYKGISIGVVKSVKLSEDLEKAIATILMQPEAEVLMRKNSTFLLINPKVGWDGIVGLETLVSGSYILFTPNKKTTETTRKFVGTINTSGDVDLNTSHSESVTVNDGIFHRGIQVGKVLQTTLDYSGSNVWIRAGIEPKYAYLIRNNTTFWKKQGVTADMGLFGSDIKINSLDTIMRGGIEFATPSKAAPRVAYGHKFNLQDSEPENFDEREKWQPKLRIKKSVANPDLAKH
jgi:paraquat-inducible protein B